MEKQGKLRNRTYGVAENISRMISKALDNYAESPKVKMLLKIEQEKRRRNQ
jgi:hypothetical protein